MTNPSTSRPPDRRPRRPRRTLAFVLAWLVVLETVAAVAPGRRRFDVPAGGAESTLRVFVAQADVELVYTIEKIEGVRTNPIKGELTAREALDRMVANTGLVVVKDEKTGALMISRSTPSPAPPPPKGPSSSNETVNPMKRRNPIAVIGTWLALTLGGTPGVHAADASAATGVVEGRVFGTVSGDYLNNARVTIDGSDLEARTNSFGEFRLASVPVGTVTVRVVVTGYAPATATAAISVGTPASLNIGLNLDKRKVDSDGTVVLDSFVVAAQREMSGSAVAINERRAASNLKNVVSADEFGDTTEGNVGEFVKYIPAVAIDYTSAEARFISLRGLPSFGTAVMIDGNRMASAAASFSRAAELDQVSLNNMSRIEVTKSPLPDTPADTIGGSVNMVLKSAFERAKPVFNYRVNLNANFNQAQDVSFVSLKKTPGPSRERTVKVKPGFDFTYINPLTKNFGFTVSVMTANQFTPEAYSTSQWKPVTTTSSLTTPDKPFLTSFTVRDGPKEIYRWSFGTTLDWRLGPRDVISLAGQYNTFDTIVVNNEINYDANGSRAVLPAAFGSDFMESASGASRLSHNVTFQHKVGKGTNLRLTHRHTGTIWNLESGAAYSTSESEFLGFEDGVVRTITARLPNLTMRFDGIKNSRPAEIGTRTAANAPIDFRQLGNYTLESATLAPSLQHSVTSSAFTNAARNFQGPIPFRLKAGVDVRSEDRDFRNPTSTWSFVGPDRMANTADDRMGLYDLVFTDYASVPQPFGFGRIERPSNHKVYDLLQAHPEYFVLNETSLVSSAATQSRKLTETIAAGFLRADLSLLRNRLKIAGGARYEETYDDGYGVLNDISATYQKDAGGRIVRDSAGRPVRIQGDAATLARLQYKDRGAHARRHYGDLYPSLNASLQVTEKLLLRTSYAKTITRPQLSNIVPSTTATDPTTTTGTPTITVSNTALKPWSSNSYDVALEYYFEQPGIVSLGVFRKDIRDFFGSVRLQATPELLAEYGFDESYANYEVVTRENIGNARVSGIEFEYRQALTFLPNWARGVSIFANGTSLHLEGESTADFSGFIRETTNWGISLSRPRYTVKINWNQRGRQRLAPVTGVNVPEGTYTYRNPRRFLDINVEWRLTKYATLFANVRNVTDVAWRDEVYGSATPAYARGTTWIQYGAQGIFGVKGTF